MNQSIDFGATFENVQARLGDSQEILGALGRIYDLAMTARLEEWCDSYGLDVLERVEDVGECLHGVIADLLAVASLLADILANDKCDVARLADMVQEARVIMDSRWAD